MISKIIDLLQSNDWGKTSPNIALARGKNELPKNFIALFNKLKK